MKQEQITAAAVELLESIDSESRPANEIINAYTRSRRYIGSKDRRALADLVWSALRHRARLDYACPGGTWGEKLQILPALFAGNSDSVDLSGAPDWVKWEVPEWLVSHIDDPERELPPLIEPAPVVLRANGKREEVQKRLAAEGLETSPTLHSPFGLILGKRGNLNESSCYREGLVEVQDEGSQCVALETGVAPGDRVLDYCAGAGGKSLVFAQMMQNKGMILAHDVSRRSLAELEKRARRARSRIIETTEDVPAWLLRHPGILFDHVVADVPCSGTGTWRRCPDMRWKLTPATLESLVLKQAAILETCAGFVRQGGFLSYMTCSLTKDENGDQIAAFLQRHSSFRLIRQKQYSPAATGTDGLFIAVMQRD